MNFVKILKILFFFATFATVKGDRTDIDVGRIRLPTELEEAWIEFMEPIVKLKNDILLAKKLLLKGLLKGGLLFLLPIDVRL